MRATINQKSNDKIYWYIPLIVFICSLAFETFLGNTLFYYSYNSIRDVQDFLNENLGISIFNNSYAPNKTEPNKNSSYISFLNKENIEHFVKGFDGNILFSEIVHFLNTNTFFLVLCAITYNFVNIYKISVLIYSIFISNFISSTLCFIFHAPRPYMAYYSIKPVIMFNEWGSPNTQLAVLIAFSLSFYEVVIKDTQIINSLVGKISSFCVIGFILLLDTFLLFASGNIAYNQIIFSICIGVVTYQIIFLIFKVEIKKSRQLYGFLKFRMGYYISINAILLSFQLILNYFIIDKSDEDYYTKNIVEQQSRLFYSSFLNDNFNYRMLFYLNKGNFCNVICFTMNIIALVALKLELYYTYDRNYETWSLNNFEKLSFDREDPLINSTQDSEDFVVRERTQWNHTGIIRTIIRLIVIIILCFCCMVPSLLVYYLIDSTTINGYIFIVTVPMVLIVFGMFYLFKVFLKLIKLVNLN